MSNFERYTKWSFIKSDHEILYLHRKFIFNERLSDLNTLGYNEDTFTTDSNNLNLYSEIPLKLSLYKIWKNRKAISNFIIYQHSIKAPTFPERKILKEAKSDLVYIYAKRQYNLMIPFTVCSVLLCFNSSLAKLVLLGLNLYNFKYSVIADWIFMFNFNEFLMKYQIGSNFKLGKETSEFLNYLNSPEETKFRPRSYYDKFNVDDIFEVKLEKEDMLYNYLSNEKYEDHFDKLLKEKSKIKN